MWAQQRVTQQNHAETFCICLWCKFDIRAKEHFGSKFLNRRKFKDTDKIARHLTTPKNSSSPGKLFGKINEKNLFIHFNYLYFSYHLLARHYDAFHYR